MFYCDSRYINNIILRGGRKRTKSLRHNDVNCLTKSLEMPPIMAKDIIIINYHYDGCRALSSVSVLKVVVVAVKKYTPALVRRAEITALRSWLLGILVIMT